MVSELEHALECARRNALIQDVTAIVLGLGLLLALDRQRVFLRLNGKLVFGKAGHRNGNSIGVLAGALDVVGRVTGLRLEAIEHREEPIKTNG